MNPPPAAPSHDHILELMRGLIVPTHTVLRDIRLPIGRETRENDAEHSWSLAVLGCCLAPLIDPTLDLGLLSQIAIAHDIVEVLAGDTSVFAGEDHSQTKGEREAAALEEITTRYGQFPWLATTIHEYKDRATPEAKFVYALDKYLPILYDYLDEGAYLKEHGLTHVEYEVMLDRLRPKAHAHAAVGHYFDDIRRLMATHPEYFA